MVVAHTAEIRTTNVMQKGVWQMAETRRQSFESGSNWEKLARHATWVSGQSRKLSPGSTGSTTRRTHNKKTRAYNKKVIRPRIVKQHNPDRSPE
jgi:hypothetical protein